MVIAIRYWFVNGCLKFLQNLDISFYSVINFLDDVPYIFQMLLFLLFFYVSYADDICTMPCFFLSGEAEERSMIEKSSLESARLQDLMKVPNLFVGKIFSLTEHLLCFVFLYILCIDYIYCLLPLLASVVLDYLSAILY